MPDDRTGWSSELAAFETRARALDDLSKLLRMSRAPKSDPITATKFNLFMPASLRAAMSDLADRNDRPLAREVRQALAAHVERHREEPAHE